MNSFDLCWKNNNNNTIKICLIRFSFALHGLVVSLRISMKNLFSPFCFWDKNSTLLMCLHNKKRKTFWIFGFDSQNRKEEKQTNTGHWSWKMLIKQKKILLRSDFLQFDCFIFPHQYLPMYKSKCFCLRFLNYLNDKKENLPRKKNYNENIRSIWKSKHKNK